MHLTSVAVGSTAYVLGLREIWRLLTLFVINLSAHAQRGLRYLACVSVCVSVIQHLTFYVFIHATNDTNLLGSG